MLPALQPLDNRLFLAVNGLGDGPEWIYHAFDPHARNYVISGNGANGIQITGASATGNFVQGNLIGTDVTGTADVGNGTGVIITGGARGIGRGIADGEQREVVIVGRALGAEEQAANANAATSAAANRNGATRLTGRA